MLSSVDPVEHRKTGKRASGWNDISSSIVTDASLIETKKNRVKKKKIEEKVSSNNDSSSFGCDSSSCETESTSIESECSTLSQRNKENKKDSSFGKPLKESIERILTPKIQIHRNMNIKSCIDWMGHNF